MQILPRHLKVIASGKGGTCTGENSSRFLAARRRRGRLPRVRSSRQGGSTGWDTSRSCPGSKRSISSRRSKRAAEPRLPRWRECRHRVSLRQRPDRTAARACRRLVRLGVDIIVTGNNPNTVAAMKATTDHPNRDDQRCRSGRCRACRQSGASRRERHRARRGHG